MPAATLLAFGLPAVVPLGEKPSWALIAATALYGVARMGLRRSLQRFPWRAEEAPIGVPTKKVLADLPLGWPLDRIAPKPSKPSAGQFNPRRAVALATPPTDRPVRRCTS